MCWSQCNVSQAVLVTVQCCQAVLVTVPMLSGCVGHNLMLVKLCQSLFFVSRATQLIVVEQSLLQFNACQVVSRVVKLYWL